jgi:hypothetical protein
MGALEGEPLMAIGSAPPGGEQPGSAWGWGSVGSITVSQQRSRCALAPPPPQPRQPASHLLCTPLPAAPSPPQTTPPPKCSPGSPSPPPRHHHAAHADLVAHARQAGRSRRQLLLRAVPRGRQRAQHPGAPGGRHQAVPGAHEVAAQRRYRRAGAQLVQVQREAAPARGSSGRVPIRPRPCRGLGALRWGARCREGAQGGGALALALPRAALVPTGCQADGRQPLWMLLGLGRSAPTSTSQSRQARKQTSRPPPTGHWHWQPGGTRSREAQAAVRPPPIPLTCCAAPRRAGIARPWHWPRRRATG